MDFHLNSQISGDSPSSSSSTPSTSNHHPNGIVSSSANNNNPMHSWWESISKARSRIHLLSTLLPPSSAAHGGEDFISSLADSDRPARSLLLSPPAYSAVSAAISAASSGAGDDPLCHWLYDTFLSSDPDLRLVVLSFIPVLTHVYLTRIHHPTRISLSGFEAVLLALYSSETKNRNGKPVLVSIPDLSQPSLYHSPRAQTQAQSHKTGSGFVKTGLGKVKPGLVKPGLVEPVSGVLSPVLEPQVAVKSTKRACIVGVALECYYKQISHMPSWSKSDFCKFSADWAGQDCCCVNEFDESDGNSENSVDLGNGFDEEFAKMRIEDDDDEVGPGPGPRAVRIPLPWELLQPVIRILGHCLLGPLNGDDVKDAASVAMRRMYARALHDLAPQAILATRSLIQLDKRGREAKAATVVSNVNTPSKANKKPEILLVSK